MNSANEDERFGLTIVFRSWNPVRAPEALSFS